MKEYLNREEPRHNNDFRILMKITDKKSIDKKENIRYNSN